LHRSDLNILAKFRQTLKDLAMFTVWGYRVPTVPAGTPFRWHGAPPSFIQQRGFPPVFGLIN